jgi:hypothetical protein
MMARIASHGGQVDSEQRCLLESPTGSMGEKNDNIEHLIPSDQA